MPYLRLVMLFLSLTLFSTCLPKDEVFYLKATKPALNATITGSVTDLSTQTPLVGALIVLTKDDKIIDSMRISQSGKYQFNIIDGDTLRQYDYQIYMPYNDRMIVNEGTYLVTTDSIQTQNYTTCPAGFLSLTFESQGITDSMNIINNQNNCYGIVGWKTQIHIDSKNKHPNMILTGGGYLGGFKITPDTIELFKVAMNAVFDVQGFKNGRIIIDRKDTISVKSGTSTPVIFKY